MPFSLPALPGLEKKEDVHQTRASCHFDSCASAVRREIHAARSSAGWHQKMLMSAIRDSLAGQPRMSEESRVASNDCMHAR